MTATLADLLDASPLARRIADTALRYASDLSVASADWPLMAAARILADPTLADALAALPVVVALRERHVPRTWADEVTVVCDACQTAWPCTDMRLLDGLPADRDEEIR